MLCVLAIVILVLMFCVSVLWVNRKKNRSILHAHQQINAYEAQLSAIREALSRSLTNDVVISRVNNDFLATVPCRHGTFKVNLSDVHVSRSLLYYGEWMEDEIALLTKVLRKGDVVFDVGANLGTHSIAFAKAVGSEGRVVAFEPQPLIAQLLLDTIKLNEMNNLEVIQSVVSEPGAQRFSLDLKDKEKLIGNHAGVSFVDKEQSEGEIPSICLDQLMPMTPRLIKIDAEGMELNVIKGARKLIGSARPVIYAENHERKFSTPLLHALFELNYDCYWHLVPAFNADNHLKQAEDIWRGSGFNINMLCLPKERNVPLKGLIRVESETEWIEDRISIDYSHDMAKYRIPIQSLSGLECF